MQERQPSPTRRRLFAGAATLGAAAATVAVLPQMAIDAAPAAAPEPRPLPERGGGYHLSDHVKHYYKTTRL